MNEIGTREEVEAEFVDKFGQRVVGQHRLAGNPDRFEFVTESTRVSQLRGGVRPVGGASFRVVDNADHRDVRPVPVVAIPPTRTGNALFGGRDSRLPCTTSTAISGNRVVTTTDRRVA
ncbi:hypothetical protein [Saccharothrix sp. Mg75]|uniref:hypothetical protein n=1 Tax=Saccharothrix sp. Mg75 TaxID=3445357 RepID=UPI003EE85066